jgi:Fe-S-cluster-containing hydrogenase component 2
MDAITIEEKAVVNADRCIGCGLCAIDCPSESIRLVPKEGALKVPPKNSAEQMLAMAKMRGVLPKE